MNYKLIGSGWAECTLQIDGQVIVATASYLSDALADLLQSVVDLLQGQAEATASFEEEPGEYRWRFQRVDEQNILVRILWFDDLYSYAPDEKGRLEFEAKCRLRTFAGEVLSTMQQLLAQHGLAGYKEQWRPYDFPLELQEKLKRLLVEGRRAQNAVTEK